MNNLSTSDIENIKEKLVKSKKKYLIITIIIRTRVKKRS